MGKFVCLLNMASLLVGYMVGSVMNAGLSGEVKKKRATSVFGLQVMIGGYLLFFQVPSHCRYLVNLDPI